MIFGELWFLDFLKVSHITVFQSGGKLFSLEVTCIECLDRRQFDSLSYFEVQVPLHRALPVPEERLAGWTWEHLIAFSACPARGGMNRAISTQPSHGKLFLICTHNCMRIGGGIFIKAACKRL